MPQRCTFRLSMLFVLLCVLGPLGCSSEQPPNTLEHVRESGKITVLTRNNANCYYIYRDQPMGFEFELAQAFSTFLDVELETRVEEWNDLLTDVNADNGDLVAAGMTITPERAELVDFSDPYMTIQQQVIVHRSNTAITSIQDLAGQTVHVRENTTYQQRLTELNQEQDLDIDIVLHEDLPTEELIRQVSTQSIDITVADSNIALLNRRYYPHIEIAFPLEEEQSLGWAVKKGDRALLERVNAFLDQVRERGDYAKIYERYYGKVHIFDYVDLKKFHKRIQTRLPKYLPLIRQTAEQFGFDWRFIAAVIYQESHFDPRAQSYTGVKGLMQVTLTTAREMGISNRLDPAQSVLAGVKYLKKIKDRWDDVPDEERIFFTLASYNIGYGHVRDAQKLARDKGLDPRLWESMQQTLPLLRIKKYYKQTRYGYARGTEPVRYIERIQTYYDILKKKDFSNV